VRGVDYPRFQALLERFINRAEYWSAQLDRMVEASEGAEAPPHLPRDGEASHLIRI
jgi:hypothetical protein